MIDFQPVQINLEEKNARQKKEIKKFKKSFCGFFISHYRFSILLILVIVFFGGTALISLPRESEPEVEIPIGIVTTVYSGASPSDVEELITNKLEDEFKTLENVKQITSNSANSISSVVVEFEAEANLETSIRKLKDATDKAVTKLPDEAEDPYVSEIRMSDIPIIVFSLQGNFSQTELNTYSKILQQELENIPRVSRVGRSGNLKREFRVIINKEKLEGQGLNISGIVSAISFNNANLPVGDIKIDNINYQLRVQGEINNQQDLANLAITTKPDGTVIKLNDIAQVNDFFEEQQTISRLSLKNEPAQPTVSLAIYKRTGGNILKIISQSKEKISELQNNKTLPTNLNIITTSDNSQWVADDLNRLGKNAITTIIIIFVILFFVLGWREALIASTAIPLSFFLAFLFLDLQGQTLNGMVLFALVLSLGLLVDNIIVIMEGIYDNINAKKMEKLEGTLLAVKTFFWPVTSGTMTTVGAFLPMLLVSGIMGQYMGIIPKTVSAVLLSALFVSVTLIPAMASKILKKNLIKKHLNHEIETNHQNNSQTCLKFTIIRRKIRDHFFQGITKIKIKHENLLKNILPHKQKRKKYILISWILFVVFTSFPFIGILGIEMFPKIDIDYFYINIKTPIGSTIEVTNSIVKKVEDILYQTEDIDNFVTSIGSNVNVGLDWSGGSTSANKANITVNLIKSDERKNKSFEIADQIRSKVSLISQADIKIEELSAGPPSGKPVEVRIVGEDLTVLNDIANIIISELKAIEGAVDIDKDLEDSTGEFVLYPKNDILSKYGLNTLTFASILRQQVYGTDASEINLNNEEVKINVAINEKQLISINDVDNMLITTPTGQTVPLSVLTTKKFEPSLVTIKHQDGDRIVIVSANTKDITAKEIFSKLEKNMKNYQLPIGYKISYGGEMEDIQKSFQEIFLSFFVAIIIIATILVLQFDSFKQPLIIMSTLPLAMIGVFFGLSILRLEFSLPAFIGIVGLAGIVVNDAIILIDKINQNIYSDKMPLYTAILEASQSRMQPIFLTTITTVAGILPLGLSDPMWAGLAFSIVFGLTFATFLTLVMVPIMYVSLEGKRVAKYFNGEIGRND